MNEDLVIAEITETLPGVSIVEADGNHFFFYDQGSDTPPDWRLPFATLVANDAYDTASNLNRPGVFRLNFGLSRDTYRALFGDAAPRPGPDGIVETGHDFTALDRIMPHPIYAPQFWLCVLNPSETTFEEVKPLFVEAYERAARRQARVSGNDRA